MGIANSISLARVDQIGFLQTEVEIVHKLTYFLALLHSIGELFQY